MKKALTAAVLALALAPALAQQPDVILTMNAYGPIQIGMPVAQVRTLLTQLGRTQLPPTTKVPTKGCAYYQASKQLAFMLQNGKVVRIETEEPHVVTPSGIRIGTSVDKVRRTLGSRIEDMQQHYAENPALRTIVLVSGDKKFAIRADTGETVTQLFAGEAYAIRYAEGCA